MSDKGKKENVGNCVISEDVIASIASAAALEISGVAGMANKYSDIKGVVSSVASKAVGILNNDNETSLDVYVNLKAGVSIPDVAFEIQKNVKSSVQSMTESPINKVNVHIEGIIFDDDQQ